jgi:nitroreductase
MDDSKKTHVLAAKLAVTQAPIHPLLSQRWSGRAFDASKPVSRSDLLSLLEAARWAPSSFGDEPWQYLIWDRSLDADGWQQAFSCLVERNQSWVKNAPLLLLSVASPRFRHNDHANRFAQHDTGAASLALVLQASALGLMAHQMGGFDLERARERFAIPPHYTPIAMIAVGHPASADVLQGDLRDRELAPRKRLSLTTNFYRGKWGVPFEAK